MNPSDAVCITADVDWTTVVAATYRIEQSINYEYAEPITRLHHRLVIAPRITHGDQRRLWHELCVVPDVPARHHTDTFGNDVVTLEVPRVERSLAFTFNAQVMRDLRLGEHVVLVAGPDLSLAGERRLIRPDEALLDAAADLRARYSAPDELAQAVNDFVFREMVYTKNVTDVFTTGAVAFSMRRGVCQDYAHIAIAISRACGLAARYVSGHLIGEGATHAWVEFLLPSGPDRARVVSLDPTNDRPTNLRYVVVAVGRDYEDVAPTSGVFVGRSAGAIDSRQSIRVTDITTAA